MDIYQLYSYINDVSSPDPRIRYRAITHLGTGKDLRCVAPLLTTLNDSDRWCRITAVRALGDIGHPSARPSLENLLSSDDNLIVSTAIISLKSVGDEKSLGLVAGFLLDAHPRICADAVEAVGELSFLLGNRTHLPAIKPLLYNRNNRVVANAVVALCRNKEIPPQEMVQFIREKLLSSPEKWTRASGIFVLGAIGCGEEELIQGLNDQSIDVVMNVIKSLGRVRHPASAHALVDLLARENIRHKVVTALGELGDRTATQPLLKYFPVSNIAVQRKIIQSLGSIGDPAAIGLLVGKLDDEHVVLEAVVALGRMRHPKATQALLDLLGKPLPHEVELAVIDALGNAGDPSIIPALMNLFQTPQPPRIFETVSWALAKFKQKAVPQLFSLLEKPQAAQYALRAFSELGEAAVSFLIEHLRHPQTAENSMKALVQIGETAVPFLRDAFSKETGNGSFRLLICQCMYRILSPNSLEFFVQNLSGGETDIRRFSAFVLPMFGNYDAFKGAIVEHLSNEDPMVRVACVRVLSQYRAEPEIQGRLAGLLDDPYWAVRYYALGAVSDFETPELLGRFKSLIESDDSIVSRKAVQQYLQACGVSVGDLIAGTNEDLQLLEGIFPILTNISDREEVEELLPLLKHSRDEIRDFATRVFLHVIEFAKPVLMDHLSRTEGVLRNQIARILGKSGSLDALPIIAELLKKENRPDQRQPLIESLSFFGPKAVPVLLSLFESHEHKDDIRLQEMLIRSLDTLNQKPGKA